MNKKKKIIFVNNNMKTGGVQKSLCNLLNEICDYYDITLLLFDTNGEYLQDLPQNISVVACKGFYKYFGISQNECKNITDILLRGVLAFITKRMGLRFALKVINLFQKSLYDEYDCAISFLHEGSQKSFYGGCNEFVLKKIRAKKKIAWIHCDFEQCGANNHTSKKIYLKFDEIVACSEGCRKSFVKCLPELENKCIAIRNCNNYENVKNLAGDGVQFDKTFFNIVTVARLSKEKGIERAIEAVKFCIDKGQNVKYHVVGSGIEEQNLKAMVKKLQLEDCVVFYGNQVNPYKYIKNADLFLLTSYHEAAPMVFDEAACLGVPIFATRTTSINEMILECSSGFVCENSLKEIKIGLLKVLEQPKQLKKISSVLKTRQFDNRKIVANLKKLF